jgi:hypothetical protein
MKGNYVAKHMNTVNRNSVHVDQKRASKNVWNEHDLEEFNLSIMKHFNTLSDEEKQEFLYGRWLPNQADELDEDQLKYLETPKNRGKSANVLYIDDAGFLGDKIDD